MNNQLSGLWSLNKREAIKGFLLALAAALLTLAYGALSPVVSHFVATNEIDITLFTTVVNFATLKATVLTTFFSYFGLTASTGEKGKLFKK
jgi:hypothetical protein